MRMRELVTHPAGVSIDQREEDGGGQRGKIDHRKARLGFFSPLKISTSQHRPLPQFEHEEKPQQQRGNSVINLK